MKFVCSITVFSNVQCVANSVGQEQFFCVIGSTVLHIYCTFMCLGKLNVHLRSHRSTAAKNFKCCEGECQKIFYSNEGLRRHKLTHLGNTFSICDMVMCSHFHICECD